MRYWFYDGVTGKWSRQLISRPVRLQSNTKSARSLKNDPVLLFMEWPQSLQVARGGAVTLLPALLVTMLLVLRRPKARLLPG